MRVGVVCAQGFGDMEQVRSRLAKGIELGTDFVVRSRDRIVAPLLEGANVETMFPDKDVFGDGARLARDNQMLNEVDHMLVFHREGSGTTDYFVRKARDWPYSTIFGPKTTIVEAKEMRKKSNERRP